MYLFDLDGTLIDSNGIWAEVDRTAKRPWRKLKSNMQTKRLRPST